MEPRPVKADPIKQTYQLKLEPGHVTMRTNFCDMLARSIKETFVSSDSFCGHRGMSSEDFERVDTRGQSYKTISS